MLKIRRSTVRQCIRCKGNSESANRFFKRINQQYNQSIEQSINPALENYYKRPDILPHLLPPGSKRRNDPVDLYNARLETDYSNQRIAAVKAKMAQDPINEHYNMSIWEFQKRPWKTYGPKNTPYHETLIVQVEFAWNNIRFRCLDPNWQKYYEGHDETDLADIRWQEHFPEKVNLFFTKLGPYGSQVLYSDMRVQGFQGSASRVEANVEYVAGKFGDEIVNRGWDPYARLVLDFWGKNKGLKSTVIKGILSSGVRVVSFTESTADAEIVKPKYKQKYTAVHPDNTGMWHRFWRMKDAEAAGKEFDEPEE